MKLRCYCCGDPIGDTFMLVHAGEDKDSVDRVFVMSLRCAPKADGTKLLVERVKPRRQRSKTK